MLVSIHIMNNQRIDMGATEKWQPCEVFVVKCAFHRNFLFWGCSILPGAMLVLGTRTGGGLARAADVVHAALAILLQH